MCALRYAFDASNFVSLFYKIVKVDHGVSLVRIVIREGFGHLGINLQGGWDEFCEPTKMKKKKKEFVVLSFVNTPRFLFPDIKSKKVLADEAKLYTKPPIPTLLVSSLIFLQMSSLHVAVPSPRGKNHYIFILFITIYGTQ